MQQTFLRALIEDDIFLCCGSLAVPPVEPQEVVNNLTVSHGCTTLSHWLGAMNYEKSQQMGDNHAAGVLLCAGITSFPASPGSCRDSDESSETGRQNRSLLPPLNTALFVICGSTVEITGHGCVSLPDSNVLSGPMSSEVMPVCTEPKPTSQPTKHTITINTTTPPPPTQKTTVKTHVWELEGASIYQGQA
ncbi:hypothetical protein H920_04496 [Fukomys damarensis]|uniref:Uncharacterized protein n=1 Tax=Fukomys damarensis TaxID=885580 RepID=A0A091DV70_FUKDA|nr:hypothetical protein H920_04496 [Fukomys damarensis]